MEMYTTASPQDAWAYLANVLTANGIQLTYQQPPSMAGQFIEHRSPNVFGAIVLLFLCIIPGIVYLVTASRTRTHHVSLQFTPEGTGCRIMVNGAGWAVAVAQSALSQLPV